MRTILFITVIALLTSACSSPAPKKKKVKVNKKELFGSYTDSTYSNEFFNFTVSFEKAWKVDARSMKSVMFGGELFEAKYRLSHNRDYPINITMEAEKANPFGSKSPFEKLKESQEGYEMFLSSDGLTVSDFDKATIAGEYFAHAEFITISDEDTSYIHEYYRYQDKYFLSIVCIYNTKLDEKKAMDLISSIEKVK